jgi:hypothetical protein
MYNLDAKTPINVPTCEPCEPHEPLMYIAEGTRKRLESVLCKAEAIYEALYSDGPAVCDEDKERKIFSLNDSLKETSYMVCQIEDILMDTLARLRG